MIKTEYMHFLEMRKFNMSDDYPRQRHLPPMDFPDTFSPAPHRFPDSQNQVRYFTTHPLFDNTLLNQDRPSITGDERMQVVLAWHLPNKSSQFSAHVRNVRVQLVHLIYQLQQLGEQLLTDYPPVLGEISTVNLALSENCQVSKSSECPGRNSAEKTADCDEVSKDPQFQTCDIYQNNTVALAPENVNPRLEFHSDKEDSGTFSSTPALENVNDAGYEAISRSGSLSSRRGSVSLGVVLKVPCPKVQDAAGNMTVFKDAAALFDLPLPSADLDLDDEESYQTIRRRLGSFLRKNPHAIIPDVFLVQKSKSDHSKSTSTPAKLAN